jgi:hypothetical protein|tara:strand:+ start:33 stop:296 length:264 start_codon:yes stop_codon:yes gene_type:complete
MSTKIKQELPKWFKGQVYEEGAVVQNPFSGEECKLNNIELSMYDFIVGAQMCFDMGMPLDDKILKEFHKGLRWFSKNNIDAYMKLLD